MPGQSTRDQIVDHADELFYARGFDATSFADIAQDVGISRGNFYYHFKTKDAILDAVIDLRLSETQAMLDRWEDAGDTPLLRIQEFVNILIANRAKIMLHGCPVGTLCTELAKLDHHAKHRAREIFSMFGDWLARQFRDLGCSDPEALAMHVLVRSQGVALLANAFRDEAFIRREVDSLNTWLGSVIPNKHNTKRK